MSVEKSETTSLTGTCVIELSGEAYHFIHEQTTAKSSKIHCKNVFKGCRTCSESVKFLHVPLNV